MDGLVKHYQNTMKGIPQLMNTWGSMIKLLDAVLVTGFNIVPALSLSKATPTSLTATINLGNGHGFVDRQVIRVAGSTNGWDGDYKVLSADADTITVECTAEHASAITDAATCFTAPLDFEIVHQTPNQSTTPKRAYRSTDPESLGLILLVHDFCVSGASTTGAKFAKVGIVSSMSDIDNITGSQMPYNEAKLNANWGWDGEYHGWAKWYYLTGDGINSNTYINDSAAPTLLSTDFSIVGSSKAFAINLDGIGRQASTMVSVIYGFIEFYDTLLSSSNLILLCAGAGAGVRYKQNDYLSILARSALVAFGSGTNAGTTGGGNLKGLLWFNSRGVFEQTSMLRPPYLDVSGGELIFSDLLIIDSKGSVRGVLPFIKTTTIAIKQNGFDMYFGKYINIHSSYDTTTAFTRYSILLESL